ncbi:hypothetical protein VKT23_017280 [Stygiomarasmius scandens]|uniref:Heterokaryon incompatibility domain-containing protein n=1 Tax=Marasmiellus scandens TaxID=2682957 RepID=A0ABR1IWV9_9AGAR
MNSFTVPSKPSPCEHDTHFPYASLSDEAFDLFSTHSCHSSHRLVLEEEGIISVANNPHSPDLLVPINICPRRLINTRTFKLVEFCENSIVPPYAILSHKWIPGEEITYEEFIHQENTVPKSRFQKIRTACHRALQDGINYIWVDTCCIKQRDHDDVAANITSMYAYYQNAQVCYAYLVDVLHLHGSCVSSEWFKRTWTLQELVAPRTVIFFNKRWQRIGNKHDLRDGIHRQTTIPISILSAEQSVQDIDVLTRLSWAKGRSTTIRHDEAFCLQGLLGVTVEPDYEESSDTSFNRLGAALFSIQPELKGRLRISNFFRSHRWIQVHQGKEVSIMNPTSPNLMVPIDVCPHRLIDTYTLKLVEFDEDEITPPYAVLSHRWVGRDEVVYTEFLRARKKTFSKSGYRKIQAACRQAREDNIRYIWIDTCCIQQGNHEDVAANITSMYAYYQNSEVCYAYLTDLRNKSDLLGNGTQPKSDWFRRGWTLQELLAPRSVIFFNKHWRRIGDKHELRDDIHRLTTIPPAILAGSQSIQDIDVLTRMSWAMRRKTTKAQDEAYCLQGLLGVTVEPDYEEDPFASFNRLGQALFGAYPVLKEKLGISDDLFQDPNSDLFSVLLRIRFSDSRDRIINTR